MQLCRLLEADYAHSMGKSTQSLLQIMAGVADAEISSKGDSQQHLTSFVSYDVFLNSYWKHFPQPLTKGLGAFSLFDIVVCADTSCRSCARVRGNHRQVLDSCSASLC